MWEDEGMTDYFVNSASMGSENFYLGLGLAILSSGFIGELKVFRLIVCLLFFFVINWFYFISIYL